MTNQEFSDEFDVLYNNIMSNQAPGLDEYEKSVFLTKAQDEIIKAYFSPAYNKAQEGFDGSQKRQYDFSNLTRTATLFNVNTFKDRISTFEKFDKRSQVFLFPDNYFLSINELIYDSKQIYSVIPISFDEYQRLMLKPYAFPVKKAAWRIFTEKKNCNYARKYVKVTTADGIEENRTCDYTFLSSWADQKRTIKLTIKVVDSLDSPKEIVSAGGIDIDGYSSEVQLGVDTGWSDDKLTYEVEFQILVTYTSSVKKSDIDDETAVSIIRQIVDKQYTASEDTFAKAVVHTDGLAQMEAPSKFTEAQKAGGLVLTTSVISLPIAEIIGKFSGNITYQIRYLRRPTPIILADLDAENISIRGENKARECELSAELHPEILQRAVELAKAAYTGDLQSQIALGQASATEKGVVQQSR